MYIAVWTSHLPHLHPATGSGVARESTVSSDPMGWSKGSRMLERLLTAEEAAKLLNVKVNTLAQWRANRARLRPLPYIRSGLKVCYRESDIAKYLETCVIIPGLRKKKLRPRNRRAA